jgi:LacI family transcriptional regulator
MSAIPRRLTLVHQLTAIVRQEIADGTWKDWLPSERSLSERLQVSRNTLRTALEELAREGVIQPTHGAGNRILTSAASSTDRERSRDVAVLTPDPLQQLRPSLTLWIEQLRVVLHAQGYNLRIVQGRQYFRANPGPLLHRLIRQHDYACWILLLANEGMQRWFAASGQKCVVAGTVYEGLDLPFCAADHAAMCGHVARLMLERGHRQLALLLRRSGLAADLASERGFRDAVKKSAYRGAEATVCHHHDSVTGIAEQLRQLMRRSRPPTALLVTNAHYYLTVATCLQQMGKRIRHDVSVVSRTDDPFLGFLSPEPARYTVSADAMARGLAQIVLDLLQGREPQQRAVRILPQFNFGESLGACPK